MVYVVCSLDIQEKAVEANAAVSTVALGDTIPEFEVLGYGKVPQAYFIRCGDCEALFATDAEAMTIWNDEQEEVKRKMQELQAQAAKEEEAE